MKHRLIRGCATVLIAASLLGGVATSASAANPVITVNYGANLGAAKQVGQGFLYGLAQNGTGAANTYLDPLRPNFLRGGGARLAGQGWIGDGYQPGAGYQARINSAIAQARVANAYGAEYVLMFSDLWGADTAQPANAGYPCDNNNCSNWVSFVARVVNDVRAAGVQVTYEPWNEPDNPPFYPRGMNSPVYFQLWDTAFRTIRSMLPTAKIAGPAVWHPDRLTIRAFLAHAKAANTVPNTLDVHNLDNDDPIGVGQMLRGELAGQGISGVSTSITEYLSYQQLNPGGTAWYLSRLARSGVDKAARGVFPQQYPGQAPCCMADDLAGILVPNSGALRPTGQYWVYRAFATLKGNFVGVSPNGAIDGVASFNGAYPRSTVLIGATPGGGPAYTGGLDVRLTNIPNALSLGGVRVQVSRIPERGILNSPIVIAEQVLTPVGGAATLSVDLANPGDALWVSVTPANAVASTWVDSSVTSGPNRFSYGAAWKTPGGIPDLYGGTATTQLVQAPTSMTFTFTGTGVNIFGVKDVDQGIGLYSIDGGPVRASDGYSPFRDSQALLFSARNLAYGTHTVTITAPATRNPASASTIVAIDAAQVFTGSDANLLANGGFESGFTPWTATLYTAASYTEGTVGATSAYQGATRLTHYAPTPYQAYTYQTVNVPNGTYTATAWAIRGGPATASYFEAKDFGGSARIANVQTAAGWQALTISGIVVTNGQVTIGLYDNAAGGSWTSIDNIRLVRND